MSFLAAIPAVISAALVSGAATVAATALAGKPKAPTPASPVIVKANTELADQLAGRRGSRANMRTGAAGAEAPASGGKTKLGA